MGKGGVGGGVQERVKRTEPFDDRTDREARRQTQATVDSLELLLAPTPLVERQSVENRFSLAPGDYGAQVVKVAGTYVAAVAPGVRFVKRLEVKADAVFVGVEFAATEPSAAELVVIRAGATVLFSHCIFRRRSTDTATYVLVEDNAFAVFNGAAFFGTPVTGDVIDNQNGVQDVRVVGSINMTGNSFGGVTVDDSIP